MEDYLKIIHDLQSQVFQMEKKLNDFTTLESDLKKTVEKLQLIEKQHLDLQKTAKIGYYTYNILQNFWTSSTELNSIFGIDDDFNKSSENWITIVHPDDKQMINNYLATEIIQNHRHFDKQYKIINQKTGEEKWVHGFGNLKLNENNQAEILSGTIQDITERKKIEIDLINSEEKFRKAFFTSPNAINLNRMSDGMYISVNDGFLLATGYKTEEVIGRTSFEIDIWVNPTDREKLVEGLKKFGKVENLEAKFRAKNGDIIDGLMSASVIELEGIPHLLNITRVVTEQKKEQEALAESERKLNTLINNLQGIAYKCRFDADWTMEFISSGFEKITGYKCDDIIENTTFSFNHLIVPEDRERVFSEVSESLIIENKYEVNFRITNAAGDILYLLDRGVGIRNKENEIIALEGFITDITKQVKIDEELRESENRFKDLVEMLPEAIFETDLNFRFTYVNKRAHEISGYSEEDIKNGLNGMEILAPEERVRAKENFNKRFYGTDLGTVRYTAIKKDGTHFQVLFHANTIFKNGKVAGLRGIIIDISDRIKAENTLRENEQKLRLIINNSPFGISTTDLEGHFIDVNPALCNIIGYSKEEMLGKHFNTFSFPDDKEKNRIKFQELTSGKIPFFEIEKRYIHKKGNIVYVLIRSQLIHDHKGSPLFQTAMIEDISERKKAEQIQKVLYNISNAVVSTENLENLIGLIRNELSTIIDTTNFFVALYDEKSDTITLPFFTDEKEHHTFIPKGKSLTQYVIDTQKSLLATYETKKKLVDEGKLEHIGSVSKIWLGVPLKTEGRVTGVLAIQSYKDENAFNESDVKMLEFVSEQISISIQRKKFETELKKALDKANESDRLKSSFLATISHELRTPLNAIIGFSEFFEKNLPPEDVEKFGQIIYTSGLHLLSIVNDLFDITLIESGETRIKKEDVNLGNILKDVFTVISSNTKGNSNIKFELAAPLEYQDYYVNTDENKLKQILINLLKNAFKFTQEGYVRYGFAMITENGMPFIRFFVEDTGIGISKNNKELIFEIFRQVDESNSRRYGGAGIGLSVAKRLTELLGGRIWLESDPGKGSCFYFTIPAGAKEESKHFVQNEKETIAEFKEKLILIAEDDEASYTYLKTVLNKKGITSVRARNGEEAVDLCFSNNKINLILMDINMPVMNGYIATKKIKEKLPDIPIIAQTAYAVAGDREKIVEAGCNEYISKPINAEELTEKIERLLNYYT